MISYQRCPLQKQAGFVYKRNLLPGSKIFTNVGDVVKPESILASGWKRSGYRVFELATLFDLKIEKAKDLLKRTIGSRVYKGDILAVHKSWFGLKEKIFRSPVTGIIVDYNPTKTRLTIQYLPTEVKMVSGFMGKVMEIHPDEFIKLGTKVDMVKGVIGFGISREASLVEIGYPDIPIHPDQINSKHTDKIIFGGTKISFDALYKALSIGVKAIITGGVEYEDFVRLNATSNEGRFEDIGLSLIITEGFGSIPIYPKIYSFLKESEHRHVIVLPEKNSVIIPVPADSVRDQDIVTNESERARIEKISQYAVLKPGMKVRVLSDEDFGKYGILSKISSKREIVEVALEDKSILVPAANVEIIQENHDQ